MTRETLRSAIGGPNALSAWSLIVILPLGVLAATLWGLRNGLALGAWLPVVIGLHAALIVPFAGCRWLLVRASANEPRPLLGLGTFAFLGAVRVVLIVFAGSAMGVALPTGSIIDFLPNGVGTGLAILGVVAIVVDGSRAHRDTVKRLAELDADFDRIRAFDEAELASVERRTVEQVASLLGDRLRDLQSTAGDDPAEAATRLRVLASEVVRPLSHDLAGDDDWAPRPATGAVVLPRGRRLRAVVEGLRPVNPIVPFLLIELIALPSAISERVGGVAFAAFVMLLGGGIMLTLSWLLARLWPAGRTTIPRAAGLVLAYGAIGTFAAWVMLFVTRVVVGVDNPLWIAPFFLIATSIGLGLRASISEQHRATEERMAESVARNAQASAATRDRAARARRRIAKLLHGNVQAELTAAAMAMQTRAARAGNDAPRAGAEVTVELERLARDIEARLQDPTEESTPIRTHVEDLVLLWSGVLEVSIEGDEGAWQALEGDVLARQSLDDVICEGLTNIARHGSGAKVAVTLHRSPDGVLVAIASAGTIGAASVPGLGSQFLSEASRSWRLEESRGEVRLIAVIGVSPAAA